MMETSAPSTAAPGGGDANNADTKVLTDLQNLSEQIDLCVEMLRQQDIPPGRPVDSAGGDEALLGVVGFLEACAPRMVDLVEAAAQGALLEGTLMKCLEVNDRLLKVLSDCDGKGGEGGSAAPAAPPAAAAAQGKSDLEVDLDDLLLDDTPASPEAGGGGGYKQSTKIGAGRFDAPPPSGAAAKGGDPFGASTDLLVPTPAGDGGGKKPAVASASDFTIDDADDAGDGGGKKEGGDDDFDAFFKERTS